MGMLKKILYRIKLPQYIKNRVKIFRFYKKLKLLRIGKYATKILGTEFKSNPNKIELDITWKCNMSCFNCGRRCPQARTDEHMSPSQIRKFIKESVEQHRRWKEISIHDCERWKTNRA